MTATESVYAAPEASDAGASMYAVYQPSEELLEQLASAPTADAVLEYLRGECEALLADRKRNDVGYTPPPIDHFFSPSDLSIYNDAMAWWPRVANLPPQCVAPSIYQLIWRYHDHTFGSTFVERLTKRAEAAQAWLVANGHADQRPGETKEQRAKRLNAEAQARYRARRSGKTGADAANATASAYRRYMDVCLERKAAQALFDAEWGPKVHAARTEWDALKKSDPPSEG